MDLYEHQLVAYNKLKNGNILCGGVGSGKSRTALAYYYEKIGKGNLQINGIGEFKEMSINVPLYIITTARKRDTKEWEEEALPFHLDSFVVDSWNNIGKYIDISNAFFIFDEQRVVGYGAWSKAFIKIAKKNKWILLTATPGDSWIDYAPVMIANGYYMNITQFKREHVICNSFVSYPVIDRYISTDKLFKIKNTILVNMDFEKQIQLHSKNVFCNFNKKLYFDTKKNRWNYEEDLPIENAGELCRILRKIVNSDSTRLDAVLRIYEEYNKIIIFYNFNYELKMLREFCNKNEIVYSEWNGHLHQEIPNTEKWIYLVQYTAGAEGWNCIKTNCVIFYSRSYSYKQTVQAAGRIDRLNTPYKDLYYFYLTSDSSIDNSIFRALKNKKDFNERTFIKF